MLTNLEQSIKNVEELVEEVKNRTFLPKRFRKLPQGELLQRELNNYVRYLKDELRRLQALLARSN